MSGLVRGFACYCKQARADLNPSLAHADWSNAAMNLQNVPLSLVLGSVVTLVLFAKDAWSVRACVHAVYCNRHVVVICPPRASIAIMVWPFVPTPTWCAHAYTHDSMTEAHMLVCKQRCCT